MEGKQHKHKEVDGLKAPVWRVSENASARNDKPRYTSGATRGKRVLKPHISEIVTPLSDTYDGSRAVVHRSPRDGTAIAYVILAVVIGWIVGIFWKRR